MRDAGYEGWLAGQSDADPNPDIGEDDLFIIRHTGGTTGQSKGVAYTHRAWLAAGRDWFYAFPPVEPGDKCLHLGPISHGSGYQYLPMWLAGGCNIMLDHFDVRETLDVMEREGIAFGFMVPTMVNAIIQDNSAPGARLLQPEVHFDWRGADPGCHRLGCPRSLWRCALSRLWPNGGAASVDDGAAPVVRGGRGIDAVAVLRTGAALCRSGDLG